MNHNSRKRMGTITTGTTGETKEERFVRQQREATERVKMDRYNYIKKRSRVDGYSS